MIGDNRAHFYRDEFSTGLIKSKFSVGIPGTYVLNSAIAIEGQAKIAASLSNNFVNVYDVNGRLLDDYAHEEKVTGIKYSEIDPACLFTSCLDGKIRVFDSRCQGVVQTFVDDSDAFPKPLVCFDYNLSEILLCGGTEAIREDTFLLFWDRRTSELLGGYWNSHTNDMTQVKFRSDIDIATASLDGLINIFDLSESNEEDALKHTLNTESAVNMVSWMDIDTLSCITCLEEFQIWAADGATPVGKVTKKSMPESEVPIRVDYMIDTLKIYNSNPGCCYLATGTHKGTVNLWNLDKNTVNPYGFSLNVGHDDTIRTIAYNRKEQYIATGGEDGYLCVWKIFS